MKVKRVIIDAQSLLRIFADYCKREDLPKDAIARKLLVKPADKKFALIIDSPAIPEGAAPIEVKFDISRVYGVGGKE